METVVLNWDIARLVFDYLKNQRLKKASNVFVKTSPYLLQELCAFEQGFQTYSFLPQLEEIICEFVKITRSVEWATRALPETWRAQLQHKKLSDNVQALLTRAVQAAASSPTNLSAQGASIPDEQTVANSASNSSSSICSSVSAASVQSDKENNKQQQQQQSQKRKRKSETSACSSEGRRKVNSARLQTKRRRVLEQPFCFVGSANPTTSKHRQVKLTSSYTTIEDDETTDEENLNAGDGHEDRTEEFDDFTMANRPAKESTPQQKKAAAAAAAAATPTLPAEISQVLLDNQEFQMKLVENINQALHVSSAMISNDNASIAELEDQQIISSNQLLDQMVKNILEATERDPTFDRIIEDVVGASSHGAALNKSCMGAQCSVESAAPRTPLVIRNAMAGVGGVNADCEQQLPLPFRKSVSTVNSSFGSLIDPNFSISKLIVVNSSNSQNNNFDSATKQTPADVSGNDQLLLDYVPAVLPTPATLDEQISFDTATGQLTFPLFLTNDGLLANFPFLINNELITQQLQPENMQSDSARIEIPLAEPIVVSAGQLPPHAIILGSNQKAKQLAQPPMPEGQLVTSIKSVGVAVPSSLDSRIQLERATPSTSGIVNGKAVRSLSTPRKRAAHVRTLTFSPRATANAPLAAWRATDAFVTPQSSRKAAMNRLKSSFVRPAISEPNDHDDAALTSTMPLIRQVEILPPRTGVAAVEVRSANDDSSSSTSHFMAAGSGGDEASNQTIIKRDIATALVQLQTLAPPLLHNSEANTPKRKQPRRTAVRACKRQLSKSSNEEEEEEAATTAAATAVVETAPAEDEASAAMKAALAEKQKLQTEWERIRNCTAHDVDTRMRELNACQPRKTTPKNQPKRKSRRKQLSELKRKARQVSANSSLNETLAMEPSLEEASAADTADASLKWHETNATNHSPPVLEGPSIGDGASKEKKRDTSNVATLIAQPKQFSAQVMPQTGSQVPPMVCIPMPAMLSRTENVDAGAPPLTDEQREKRTANIACLLDTPFKPIGNPLEEDGELVPPTPGIFLPTLETPLSKVKSNADAVLQSAATYLFGSLTKSELGTPLLNAMTPGLHFTPMSEESGGGATGGGGSSYYKPDESDDLDRNIERLLRDSTQKRRQTETQLLQEIIVPAVELEEGELSAEDGPEVPAKTTTTTLMTRTPTPTTLTTRTPTPTTLTTRTPTPTTLAVCMAIPVETLKVEPIVLKRIKSFGSETVECCAVDPHYTLISGLPDMSGDEEEAVSETSSSSTSSSSTASSSTSSSSSSSSVSSSTGRSAAQSHGASIGRRSKTPQKLHSIDQLSDISSTEDEEWQRLVATHAALDAAAAGEPNELVACDGEVRYPVRSWLTPCKEQLAQKQQQPEGVAVAGGQQATTIKVTLPQKSSVQRQRDAIADLEQKRLRMKEKLRLDSQPSKARGVAATGGSNATTRKNSALQAKMRQTATVPPAAPLPPPANESMALQEPLERRPLDVLTALNLSAKKQASPLPSTEQVAVKADNAMTTAATSAVQPPVKSLLGGVKATKTTTAPRKCQPIEPCPLPTIAGNSKRPTKAVQQKRAAPAVKSRKRQNSSANVEPSLGVAATPAKAKAQPPPPPKAHPTNSGAGGKGLRISPRLKASGPVRAQKKVNACGKSSATSAKSEKKVPPPLSSVKKALPGKNASKMLAQSGKQQKPVALETIEVLDSGGEEDATPLTLPANCGVAAEAKQTASCIGKEKKVTTTTTTNPPIATTPTTMQANEVANETMQQIPLTVGASKVQVPEWLRQQLDEGEEDEDNDDNDGDDDDDVAHKLTRCSINEDDSKHFIRIVCDDDGNSAAAVPASPASRIDLSTYQIAVDIDENEMHTWTISEEFCLYDASPMPTTTMTATTAPASSDKSNQTTKANSIRNIPKKRKVRITMIKSNSDEKHAPRSSNNNNNNNSRGGTTPTESQQEERPEVTPMATSTPLVDAKQSSRKKSFLKSSVPKAKQSSGTNAAAANPSEKIRIEDIESILSHLHPSN